MVAGMKLSSKAFTQKTPSIPPAAPKQCPVFPFVEETASF